MKYTLEFDLPYHLDAYDFVTLKERLERELQSYFDDRKIEAFLSKDDEK